MRMRSRLQARDISSTPICTTAIRFRASRVSQKIEIPDSLDEFAATLWENLNPDNKVSLFVRYIDIATRETQTKIINKNK